MPGETAEDVGLKKAENEMPWLMKRMIDKIHKNGRQIYYLEETGLQFWLSFKHKGTQCTTNEDSLKQICIFMGSFHNTYLVGLEMFSERMDWQMLVKTRADVKFQHQTSCFASLCSMVMMYFQIRQLVFRSYWLLQHSLLVVKGL